MTSVSHGDDSCGCHGDGSAFITLPAVHVLVWSHDDRSKVIYTLYNWSVSMTTELSLSADKDMRCGWKFRKKLANGYCVKIILSLKYTTFFPERIVAVIFLYD